MDESNEYVKHEYGDESELCQAVSQDEFDKALARCKNKSAPGHDNISYFLLKRIPVETKNTLCNVFSDAIRLGYFPKLWKFATV